MNVPFAFIIKAAFAAIMGLIMCKISFKFLKIREDKEYFDNPNIKAEINLNHINYAVTLVILALVATMGYDLYS